MPEKYLEMLQSVIEFLLIHETTKEISEKPVGHWVEGLVVLILYIL